MKYKVIKDYGFFKEGDILTWDEELNAYTLDVQEGNTFRSAMVDSYTVDYIFDEGHLEEINRSDEKIEEVVEFIDKLIGQYKQDYDKTMELAKNGKIQPCAKVEAETVFFNLTKVLNRVREELINE